MWLSKKGTWKRRNCSVIV